MFISCVTHIHSVFSPMNKSHSTHHIKICQEKPDAFAPGFLRYWNICYWYIPISYYLYVRLVVDELIVLVVPAIEFTDLCSNLL